jgi:hypothetical protein
MRTLDRRTVLRGIGGIALGLPWLEAMAAPGGIFQKNVRLAYLFMPNGVRPEHWNPAGNGGQLKLTKTLSPLEPIKNMVNVHTGLQHPRAKGGDGHYAKTANFLSGEPVKKTTSDLYCGISCDQVAAKLIGQDTYLPSVELAIHKTSTRIDTNVGFTQVYGGHISWSNPTTPVPKEIIPSQAYQRLFKGAKSNAGRTTSDETKSLLDYIKEDTARLTKVLGTEDRHRVNQYFHSVRSLEKRLTKMASESYRMPRDAKKPPEGKPRDYNAHVNLMLDIIVLALQTNRTKIATFMFGNSVSGQRFDFFEGVSGSHHDNSHCGNDAKKKENTEKIARYHVTMYSKMLQKMNSIKEGEGTLLDNSLVLFGSGMKDGNRHSHKDLPLLVAGKGGGKVKTGLHKAHNNGKMNNLLLGMMQTAGCQIKNFGDSDGAII